MKCTGQLGTVLAFIVSPLVWLQAQPVKAQANPKIGASRSLAAYAGRWDLTMEIPTRPRPSWIDLNPTVGQFRTRRKY